MALCACAALAVWSGAALARTPDTNAPAAYTAQTPVIQGRVVSVSDVGMVVDTDQGQRVQLLMDSRTMMPTDLDHGMEMKAEFKVLDNGSLYAKRVIPIRNDEQADRRLAYAHSNAAAYQAAVDREEQEDAAAASYSGEPSHENTLRSDANAQTTTTTTDHTTTTDQTNATTASSGDSDHMDATGAERSSDESLPDTASHMPLAALLGIGLLGAGIVAWARRPRTA
jgi:LPXTG-motif cell wall-anchored protein